MQEFYKNASVFLTGATGFLGKSVVEKLLRAVPDVDKVYVLIRPKRGQSVHSRLQQLLQSPVFDRVKQENAGVLLKIVPIQGDISAPDLGISGEDRILLEQNVSVVIHSAATIKFNENLKVAVEINVRGTQRVVQLCKGISNLKGLVYVSTAYSNCDLKGVPIQEQVYPAPPNSLTLLRNIDAMEADFIEKNVKSFIGHKPNTYTFTKALSEALLEAEVNATGIPACIVRPSMIIGAWKEPVPGWVEGINGPVGLSFALANGLLKVLYSDPNISPDFVPVDLVVNAVLTAAWETGRNRKPLTVYNCCSGPSNPINGVQFITLFQHHTRHSGPLCRAMWYPHMTVTLNRPWYEMQVFLFHYLPAHLMDFAALLFITLPSQISCWLHGASKDVPQKRTRRVVTLHKNIIAASRTVEFFSLNEWRFETKNLEKLHRALKELPESEQGQWSSNFAEYAWGDYVPRFCRGIKTFLSKEAESTLPLAKRRMERLQLLKTFCDALGTLGLFLMAAIIMWKFNNILLSTF